MPDVNLVDASWLPVTTRDGDTLRVGLRELFLGAHTLTDFTMATPPGRSALLRILASLTYRVTGLDTDDGEEGEWFRDRGRIISGGRFDPDRVNAYFDRWRDRFNLFDPDRPWRQDPRLAHECAGPAGLNTLIWSRPHGNNSTLFSSFHDGDPGEATIVEAVDALLVAQFYGSLGRCQTRTHGAISGANLTYLGPVRGRVSYHPVGDSLLLTLLAHLVPPSSVSLPNPGGVADLAAWETDTLPDPSGVKPSPVGVVSLLANDSGHALLLVPDADGTTVVDGFYTWQFADKNGPKMLGFDPYLSYRTDQKGDPKARMADAGREMWRDVPSILAAKTGTLDPGVPQPAAVTVALRHLPVQALPHVRVQCIGFVQHGFQPNNSDWYTSLSPGRVLVALSDDAPAEDSDYRTAVPYWVQHAEDEAALLQKRLYWARVHAFNLDPKGDAATMWRDAATPRYWAAAHQAFRDDLAAHPTGIDFALAATTAPARLRDIAIDIYQQVTANVHDGRALMAVVKNQPRPLRNSALAGITPTGTPTSEDSA